MGPPAKQVRGQRHWIAIGALATLLAILVAASQTATAGSGPNATTAAKKLDFGDAPDGAPAGYEDDPAVVGAFPSKKGSNGASHGRVGKLLLGGDVTAEADSKQEGDRHDDGFSATPRACEETSFRFVVDASGLPNRVLKKKRAYLNVWADWTEDGDWRDQVSCAGQRDTAGASGNNVVPEWVVENHKLKLKSFKKEPVQDITVVEEAGASGAQFWIRASVSEKPFEKKVRVDGKKIKNDGRGTFNFGETEDYFAYTNASANEQPPAAELAVCDPASRRVSHNQSPLTLSFPIVDLSGPNQALQNSLAGTFVKDLTKSLPSGWKVIGKQPGTTSTELLFKKDPGARTQRGTLTFQIRSPSSTLLYVVSCEIEVRHANPPKKLKFDYGDAADGLSTEGTPREPLCKNSGGIFRFAAPILRFRCQYPSKFSHGPHHRFPFPIHLGKGETSERDSKQVDADKRDDGYSSFFGGTSCTETTFEWVVTVENPKGKKNRSERKRLERLVKEIKKRKAKIFLNAWFDGQNDGEWDGAACAVSANQFVAAPDHAVSDERLSRKELKRLRKSKNKKGVLSLKVTREGLVGPVAAEGPGCERGTISVGERYHPDVSGLGSHRTRISLFSGIEFFFGEGDVDFSYELGETEDFCPGDVSTPPTTKCNDKVDNDGDGKIDANDVGCQTGSGGAYDPEDINEADSVVTDICVPSTINVQHVEPSATSLRRHLLRIGGTIFVERASGDADFASGAMNLGTVPCGPANVNVSWTVSGTTVAYNVAVTGTPGPSKDLVVAVNTR